MQGEQSSIDMSVLTPRAVDASKRVVAGANEARRKRPECDAAPRLLVKKPKTSQEFTERFAITFGEVAILHVGGGRVWRDAEAGLLCG